jgi:long-chain acyl-CoA synthetase
MEHKHWPNLATLFFTRAAEKGDKPFLWQKVGTDWQSTSWAVAASRTAAIARALIELGISEGDRVALVSESRPEWPMADIAIMAAGAISVPAYTTNSVRDHLHVLTDSGASGIIVSTSFLAKQILQAAIDAPAVKFVIAMEDPEVTQDTGLAIHRWNDLVGVHDGPPDGIAVKAAALTRDRTACLIYTSGTGGVPKGVMLSHGAILSNCSGAIKLLSEMGLDDEVFLSFLPLSHSYEHTAG